jgi:hypothetical protein
MLILQLLSDFNKNSGNFLQNVCDILRCFESLCNDPEKVRAFHLFFGPKSYLVWLIQNLSLYQFNGSRAKDLKERLQAHLIPLRDITIKEQIESLRALEAYVREFILMFQNNLRLNFLGITDGREQDGITSDYIDAYFRKAFYEETVPVGYLRYISA